MIVDLYQRPCNDCQKYKGDKATEQNHEHHFGTAVRCDAIGLGGAAGHTLTMASRVLEKL